MQLQNLAQSNYTTFISNLKFPFSRQEAEILREIQAEQVKFETNMEEMAELEDAKIDPKQNFAELLNEKSRIGK
jgi:hypothetical protein